MNDSSYKILGITDNTFSFVLTTEDNDAMITAETYEPLQSANIGSALVAYLLNLETDNYILGFFRDNITYYFRQDFGQRTTPSIDFYPERERYEGGEFGWLNISFMIKVSFPLLNKKEFVVETCERLCNYLTLTLNGYNCVQYVSNFSPGLTDITMDQDWEYSEGVASKGVNKLDIYIATARCKCRINMLEYYESKTTGFLYEGSSLAITLV